MISSLKFAVWNANGLCNRAQELKHFLSMNDIDVMLLSETHFTRKSFLKIPQYSLYSTNHPDGSAHGGSAIIIKNKLTHYECEKYSKEHLQATNVVVETINGPILFSSVYCPPKHQNKEKQFQEFFDTLGSTFIAAGDFNAKNKFWGSRLTNKKGKELFLTMEKNDLRHLSTGEPTYWPSDRRKVPDLLDFCIIKGIDLKKCSIESCFELSSDHSPIIAKICTDIPIPPKKPSLHNKKTNWPLFRDHVEMNLNLKIPLKNEKNLEDALEHFTKIVQQAAWNSTPVGEDRIPSLQTPEVIKAKVKENRKLRRRWQKTRSRVDKWRFNKATEELKEMTKSVTNYSIQQYLENLTPTEATNHDLWRVTRNLKQPQKQVPPIRKQDGSWARSFKEKASTFADHLEKVFTPWPSHEQDQDDDVNESIDSEAEDNSRIKKFSVKEVKVTINKHMNPKKSPGFDLITAKTLQELPEVGFRYITMIFNAVLRLNYFPGQWKVAQIVMIPKPGKEPEEVSSYRPISLLPMLSKAFEKMFLQRLKPIIIERKLIPDHQFGFREKHSTVEQVHRLVNAINISMEDRTYCTAAFLDVSQAFDKVWHRGLCAKLKRLLPAAYYKVLKSYLEDRQFYVQFKNESSELRSIASGVPQGSVLGPFLYLLFTADLPTKNQTSVYTYADDTAIVSVHENPNVASLHLQEHLKDIEIWLKKWRMKVNELKSQHITFTLRKGECPPVTLNNNVVPQTEEVKYLGLHLDKKLTWKNHIQSKKVHLTLLSRKMYWFLGPKSKMSLANKTLLYKAIIVPIWTYGIQLWGSAAASNIAVLDTYQNKMVRMITGAPWYVRNKVILNDLGIQSVKEAAHERSKSYKARLESHPNVLVEEDILRKTKKCRRLRKNWPSDLYDC